MKKTLFLVYALFFSLSVAAAPKAAPQTPMSKELADCHADITNTLGFVPEFLKLFPEAGLPGAWAEWKNVEMGPTAVPGKYKELMGIAVAAQIPCTYCLYAHKEFSTLNGASAAEQSEAIALSALVRHWSAFANGVQQDWASFSRDIDTAFSNMALKGDDAAKLLKKMPTDLSPAQQEVWKTFGLIPLMFKGVPASGLAGAMKAMQGLMMSNNTAIPVKYKNLIALSVAAQVPCHYCVYFHKKAAQATGASEAEINDAIGMAAVTRQWSTILNGNQMKFDSWKKEIDRIVVNAKKAPKK